MDQDGFYVSSMVREGNVGALAVWGIQTYPGIFLNESRVNYSEWICMLRRE